MSWQAGSFVGLGLVLVAGFAWYERERPPSQIVALTAAMAALAVAGRVALAPIPNVVATTDIVLFTGYAIGAAPGFAAGALAGLVSNFWLGQGPWTPWQMAGWGLVGVFGAVLAQASRRRLGRISLAGACGLAGIAYGALLNFSLMVTYGGEVSPDRFAALSVRAIPFDLAHAIGNITLALLAGPALVRMLLRFRARFEYSWEGPSRRSSVVSGRVRTGIAASALCLGLFAFASAPAFAAKTSCTLGNVGAAQWLQAEQNPDGGFGSSPGGSSSLPMTGWASLGLLAANRNPQDVGAKGKSPIDYLRKHRARSTGDLERTILVLAGSGVNPKSFAGHNLVRDLAKHRSADGSYEGQVNLTAFGVLAMRAAKSNKGVTAALAWLRQAQNTDGGWGFTPKAQSDADSTGAALQAIRTGESATQGVNFLNGAQQANGGFPLANGGPVNSQSTAWAVQGLVAVGTSPTVVAKGADYLASVQASNCHYRYSASSDQTSVWVTGQGLLGAYQKAFPLTKVPRTAVAPATSATPTFGGSVAAAPTLPSAVTGATPTTSSPSASATPAPAPTQVAPPADPRARVPVAPAVGATNAAAKDGLDTRQQIGLALGVTLLLAGLGWFAYRRRLWPFPLSSQPRVPTPRMPTGLRVPKVRLPKRPSMPSMPKLPLGFALRGRGKVDKQPVEQTPKPPQPVPGGNGQKPAVATNGQQGTAPGNGQQATVPGNGQQAPAPANGQHSAAPANGQRTAAPANGDEATRTPSPASPKRD